MESKKYLLSEIIILISSAIGLLSLFMPWVNLAFLSQNGFAQQGYIFLVVMIYPALSAYKKKSSNKIISIITLVIGLIVMFAYISDKSVDFFGASISAAGSGAYAMLLALIGALVGVIMNKRVNQEL
ncbi:hypothetical protein EDC18_11141 [Natranaerovirga pectinivora]|uniref:Uncharacterized protein n=1 Tax=Natranaerovirga pectinivora TaxID=682400 RepID=A0A4R3MGU8_9FIRM|nr:hypothetical protein [Natranaerovirga pectinivora]TCT12870.1 hypothetical protein EDC18_11141 [Natranaerovirga pectinivora]